MPPLRLRLALGAAVVAGAVSYLVWQHTRPFLYAGTVEADEVDLSPGVVSRIAAYDVREGDRVRKGQVVVRLACEDIRIAADQAEREYDRAKALFEAGSLPQAAYDRARATRDDLAVRRDWCTITSPVNGTVLVTYHQAGEWTRPGMNLLTLADLSTVSAVVYVPQAALAKLTPGADVEARLPELPGRRFPGRIAHIREEAEFTPKNVQTREERTRLVFGVKVALPNPDGVLKPGMTVEVDLTPTPAR